jgi:hypothetical protein
MALQAINPATGETLATYKEMPSMKYGTSSTRLTTPTWTGAGRAFDHARR